MRIILSGHQYVVPFLCSVLVHLRQAEYELAQTKTCLQSSENEVKSKSDLFACWI